MFINKYNHTFLGGCIRNKRFPNGKYHGYNLSYCNNKQNTSILGTYRTNEDDLELLGIFNGCGMLNYSNSVWQERL